ncbi:hypothetical protein AN964_15950 [Heyndrickxia shackletonii]|uniref:Uncharacterized protein n=1 Tax=Heyndrickxia shackletonii TaxID=157838 RepID=A0A0Q3WZN5_9BACI|nr:hypothetical protein [Heyndrickxia shackletonii]KQL54855.1 hypothetical protein AN964_15950 [Heyndrickxia shackletonii]MBB2479558.1 hypothetical protein [Bacillus sp. APMAM]NEY99496.1 hypothetical protein [Heyndrickxia shackletonii]RTZ57401.1 hypothetical protein EKO25_02315 [Bacillus sp. SAJ1]
MKKVEPLEAILWSIALPGFAQLLSGSLVKGILFILLEFLINVKSNFNEGIMLSFLGQTVMASKIINYQWLMFYPCLYMYAMWDAYKSAQEKVKKYSYLPFAFGAYFVTVGLMYSPQIKIFNIFIGPIFLPMIFLIPGLIIGNGIRLILIKISKSSI